MIYLDNNSTTRIAREVLDAMLPYLTEFYGNPSSQYDAGEVVKQGVGKARSDIASFLGCSPAEIIFTSGATESNHLAVLGALRLKPERRQIVATAVEHASSLYLFRHLEKEGYHVTLLRVDSEGLPDMNELADSVSDQTALVSMMWVNNETGLIFPVPFASVLAKSRGALFHTDATQALGKVRINLKEIPADLLSFSGHKIHGPKGIGGLFVRKELKLPPIFFGNQERGRRGGTGNVPGMIGLGAACELAGTGMEKEGKMRRISVLRDRLENEVLEAIPFSAVNGRVGERVSGTSNVRFGGVEAEAILHRLNRLGIMASSGSACSSGGTEPSHVLMAMGLSREEALSSVRFSLSRYTTDEEIEKVTVVLPAILEELRSMGRVKI